MYGGKKQTLWTFPETWTMGLRQDASSRIHCVPHYHCKTDSKLPQKRWRFVQPCRSCLVIITTNGTILVTAVEGKCHVVNANEEVNDKPADCVFIHLMGYRSCHPATHSCPAIHWDWKYTTENDTKERLGSQRTSVAFRVYYRVGHALPAHSRQHGTCFN